MGVALIFSSSYNLPGYTKQMTDIQIEIQRQDAVAAGAATFGTDGRGGCVSLELINPLPQSLDFSENLCFWRR